MMRSPRQWQSILIIGAVLMSACVQQRVTRQIPPCPPPPEPPACISTASTAIAVDTSRVFKDGKWKIGRVAGARSRSHEWGLLPAGEHDLLISGSSAAVSSYDVVRRIRKDSVASHGPTSPVTTVATRVGVSSGDIMGDASLVRLNVEGLKTYTVEQLPEPLNLPVFWDGHPTVSMDGNVLVFASDRPGGMGGTDLWYAVKTMSGWSEPQWVSSGVNTYCDELSPQFAGDTSLVFASAGHDTYGGYDLFTTNVERKGATFSLSRPHNIGAPVNTTYDELFPRWVDNETLYYGSDQPLPGDNVRKDFDVFVLSLQRPKTTTKPQVAPIERATITGTVIHQQTKLPVVDADVTARDATTNTVVATTRTDTSGAYALDVPVETPLDVSAQAPDVFYDDVRITVPKELARDTMPLNEPLQLPITFVLRVNFPTAIYDAPYPNTLDSTGAETQQAWEQALDLLAQNVTVSGSRLQRLVLIGHTDDVDSDESNLLLGRRRVEFIMDKLVARGVGREILEGRSAGESLLPDRLRGEPIEQWRKRARRVELVKVMRQ